MQADFQRSGAMPDSPARDTSAAGLVRQIDAADQVSVGGRPASAGKLPEQDGPQRVADRGGAVSRRAMHHIQSRTNGRQKDSRSIEVKAGEFTFVFSIQKQ